MVKTSVWPWTLFTAIAFLGWILQNVYKETHPTSFLASGSLGACRYCDDLIRRRYVPSYHRGT